MVDYKVYDVLRKQSNQCFKYCWIKHKNRRWKWRHNNFLLL